MRLFTVFSLVLTCVAASIATAQTSDFQTRLDAYPNPPTIGQLHIDGLPPCTATLIASDEVLASASCVSSSDGLNIQFSRQADMKNIEFRFFPSDGGPERSHRVVGTYISGWPTFWADPGFAHYPGFDLAIFKLEYAISVDFGTPAQVALTIPPRGDVGLLTATQTSGQGPVLQHLCALRDSRVSRDYATSMICNEQVSSGFPPVFRFENGALRLVTVLSEVHNDEDPVRILGSDIDRIRFVRNQLLARIHRLRSNRGLNDDIGARFVRP